MSSTMYTKTHKFCAQGISVVYCSGNTRWELGKCPISDKKKCYKDTLEYFPSTGGDMTI